MRQSINAGEVMIGNNEVDSGTSRALSRGKGTSAGIYADHESNARRRCTLDHVTAKIVAFANAVRDVKIGRAPAQFDRGFQNDDCGGAIHVVVAIDKNSLFTFDSGIKPLDRSLHSGHQVGRMELIKRRREEDLRSF